MATTRDPTLDNARALLIALVVIGHVVLYQDAPGSHPVYLWIYSFHMPAFVLVSGMVSQRFGSRPRDYARVVTTLLVPYAVFQAIDLTIKGVQAGEVPALTWWHPKLALWFLLALAAWRLMTPMLRQIRGALPLAIVVSLIAPLDPGLDQGLSVARILSFLPFFVLGLQLRPEHVARLRAVPVRIAAAIALVGSLALIAVTDPDVGGGVLLMNGPYPEDGPVAGVLARSALLVAGTLGAFAVLSVVPAHRTWYTGIGERTLTVYLLHAALLYPFLDRLPFGDRPWGLAAGIGAAAVLAVVLGSAWVTRATRFLITPPLAERLIRPDSSSPRT